MGYQALLFCPDERLARVISQVFTELDFSIEHVQEPFGAVKKLMALHYDALVVDCENEANASLIFKSARNSSVNQSSLGIAVVEGQAGVAKAYRIGANLVLTKPINVEQAKGTLRVARGLLRKNADASTAANAHPPAAQPLTAQPLTKTPGAPAQVVTQNVEPVAAPPSNLSASPEFETAPPAIAASTDIQESPAAVASPEIQAPPVPVQPSAIAPRTTSSPAASLTAKQPSAGQAAAAAPAPAREVQPVKKTVDFEPAYSEGGATNSDSASAPSELSFAGLDSDKGGGFAGSKKFLVAAAILLALATLGYLGWSKFSAPKTQDTPPAVTSKATPEPSAPPVASPAPVPVTTADTGATNRPVASNPVGTSKPTVTQPATPAPSSPVTRIELSTEPDTKRTQPAPIVVKSTPTKRTSSRTDESAVPVPSPLAVAATDASGLSNLTAPATKSQPALARLNISQGVSQGLLIKRVQPRYPPSALAMHIHGAVELQATIDKEGKISNLKVLKGDQVLSRAAVDAVRQWRYKPYYLDGVPVDIETQITVNFKLPE